MRAYPKVPKISIPRRAALAQARISICAERLVLG